MKHNSILNFVASVIFIFLSIALAILAYSYGGVDFNVYYAAARVTILGGNPYDFNQLAPQIISSAGEINNPYYYAPWFTWLVIPFSLLPYSIARGAWLFFNFILWLWALFNLSTLMSYPSNGWQKWGIWLLVTFVFAWSTWGSEQVGIIILFLYTLVFLFAQKEKWLTVGICLALILFKPNITAIPVVAMSTWFIVQHKQWKPFVVLLVATSIMLVISLLITHNWYLALLQPDKLQGLSYTLDSTGQTQIQRYTTTLLDWLKIYNINSSISITIYGLVLLFGLIIILWAMKKSTTLIEFSAIAILVNFLVIPYTLFYDYPSLIITLFWGNALFKQKPQYHWIRYSANASIFLALFIGDSVPYRYWIVIILTLFLGLGYFITTFNKKYQIINS